MQKWRSWIVLMTVASATAVNQTSAHGASALTFTSPLGQSASLIVDETGTSQITVENADGTDAALVVITSPADGGEINLAIDESGDVSLLLTDDYGALLSFDVTSPPLGTTLHVARDDANGVRVAVTDPTNDLIGVSFAATEAANEVFLTITYDELPDDGAERITPLFPGLANEDALGGSVTIAASGMSPESVMTLIFSYNPADLVGMNERELRVHRFTNSTGAFEPVGENNRGEGSPTDALGDYGVDTAAHTAWAVVNKLGSFAVGVSDGTLPLGIADEPTDGGGASGTICGPIGMICPLFTCLALAQMRSRRRQIDIHSYHEDARRLHQVPRRDYQ